MPGLDPVKAQSDRPVVAAGSGWALVRVGLSVVGYSMIGPLLLAPIVAFNLLGMAFFVELHPIDADVFFEFSFWQERPHLIVIALVVLACFLCGLAGLFLCCTAALPDRIWALVRSCLVFILLGTICLVAGLLFGDRADTRRSMTWDLLRAGSCLSTIGVSLLGSLLATIAGEFVQVESKAKGVSKDALVFSWASLCLLIPVLLSMTNVTVILASLMYVRLLILVLCVRKMIPAIPVGNA